MDGFSSNKSWPENHLFRLDEFSRNRSKSPSENWKFGNIIGWIFRDISKSVKRLESYDDQWFWFRWSNVKLILSWDSRIIPNKNFQIRIDYFLSHTFKRNYQFEFREKSYWRIYRLIHGKYDPFWFFCPRPFFRPGTYSDQWRSVDPCFEWFKPSKIYSLIRITHHKIM